MQRPRIRRNTLQWIGMAAGPTLSALVFLALPDTYRDASGALQTFTTAGQATAALGVWMAIWWMTEAIPVYATALLPLIAFPLVGAATIRTAAHAYGHELIFLFMGGFVLALAMERWGLHRRIAFRTLLAVGARPQGLVAGVMGVTALLSMWVSNTATAIMMLPIALSLVDRFSQRTRAEGTPAESAAPAGGADPAAPTLEDSEEARFSTCLMLGIAYSASIGGIGTLIGTPPNLFMASYASANLGVEISFVRWMGVGVPVVVALLPVTWWLLVRVLYPIGNAAVPGVSIRPEDLAALGPVSRGERATFVVFSLTAAAWILRPILTSLEWAGQRPLAGLSDTGIAIGAALLLFLIPVDRHRRVFVMDWETAVQLPWGVLILFGGGLSLAAAIESNGVASFIGAGVAVLGGLPSLLLVAGLVTVMVFLTELTSNTATTATLVPIVAALAASLGLSPTLLIVPVAISASLAFMLPVATPPNAIVFGSGRVQISQMVRVGFWLNLIGIVLITALTFALVLPLLTSLEGARAGSTPPGPAPERDAVAPAPPDQRRLQLDARLVCSQVDPGRGLAPPPALGDAACVDIHSTSPRP